MSRDELVKGPRRRAQIWLAIAATLAVANLPLAEFSWPWVTALLLPAGAVAAVRGTERWPVLRAILLTTLQVSACLLAVEASGPLPRPLALAATLLPPLAFVVVRRQDTDRALGAFLSLCVLVVGAILQPAEPLLVIAFALAATGQLLGDARVRVLDLCGDAPFAPTPAAKHGRATGPLVALAIAAAAFSLLQVLPRVPTPSFARTPPTPVAADGTRRGTGLSDNFELGGDGLLSNLRGDLLVTVRNAGGEPMPSDLYLRSGFFQMPGLDAWQVGPLQPRVVDGSLRPVVLRQPPARAAQARLQISRTQAARDLVFVAPGTFSVLGIPDLGYDAVREWFRQTSPGHLDDYEIRVADVQGGIDARTERRELLQVPSTVEARWFAPLLDELPRTNSPLETATAVAGLLQRRCRYERREPGGPYDHALLNFLHGERIGYCMHFASAAAILLRMRGVPCRIGVGLYGGEAGERGARRFGSQHAHAWVEIPLLDGGYGVFDPTPPALRGTVPQPTENAPEVQDGEAASQEPTFVEFAIAALRRHWPWFVLATLMLPLLRPRRRTHSANGADTPRAVRPARKLLLQLLAELARRGHVRPRGVTLEQFARDLQRRGASALDLQRAFAAYQDVRFGGRTFDATHEELLRKGLASARELPAAATDASA